MQQQYQQQEQSITHLIRQRAIKNNNGYSKKLQISYNNMERLNLEKCFEAHNGCVNCLDWNKSGKLLASGSDDHCVNIYDPFVQNPAHNYLRHSINTDHDGNIFSVKFMPECGDTLMATCGSDNHVKLINILASKNCMNCQDCHQDRVKRLAVHPREPNLIWSAGEDGYIMEFDIRDGHICNSSRPNQLIIDLKTASPKRPIAKCLAINPIRDEMIAVGSTDSYIRLFDRRFIKKEAWNSCIAYFSPGQVLLNSQNDKKQQTQHSTSYPCPISYGTTYVAFSPDGSELLANIHAEQIYLFNTYEPFESFKSFDNTIEPLVFDFVKKQTNNINSNKKLEHYNINPIIYWRNLRHYEKRTEIPRDHNEFYTEMLKKCRTKELLKKDEFDRINFLLAKIIDCPELYHLRAAALIQRAWKGDYYQSIRDSCSSLALNPFDYISYENLAYSAYYLQNKNLAINLLELIKLIKKDFNDSRYDYNLEQAIKALESLLKGSPSGSPLIWSSGLRSQSRARNHQFIEETIERRYGHLFNFNEISQDSEFTDLVDSQIQAILSNNEDFEAKGLLRNEIQRISNSFDYNKRFCGHCNLNTDIKEANFFGYNGEFIIAGSDDGAFYIWDKKTTNIVKAVVGDQQILNCLQPHPFICMLATSGIESTVKVWSPIGKINHDVKCVEQRCAQNQDFITSDPLEALVMMLYSSRDQEQLEEYN